MGHRRNNGAAWAGLSRRAFLGACCAAAARAADGARVVELPAVEGRIDHLSADTAGRRLFVAALGNRTVEIVDAAEGRRAATIAGVPEPQGVLFHPASGRIWAACRADGSVRIFDRAGKLVRTVRLAGGDADNIRAYGADRVVVGHGEGALSILDASGNALGAVELGAHPESFQIETARPRAYVNLPDRREIAAVDLKARTVVERWPVREAAKNYPMALDEKSGRIYVACREPARLLTVDTASGRAAEARECAGDADDVFRDAAGRRTFVIGGAGRVDVFTDDGAAGGFETAPGARTGLWVAEWKTLAVAAPRRGGRAARVLLYEL